MSSLVVYRNMRVSEVIEYPDWTTQASRLERYKALRWHRASPRLAQTARDLGPAKFFEVLNRVIKADAETRQIWPPCAPLRSKDFLKQSRLIKSDVM